MNRYEAIEVIRNSVAKGSCTPNTSELKREVYIAKMTEELLDSVIDPLGVVVAMEIHHHGTLEEMSGKKSFVIARTRDDWLVYVPETGNFSLAFGRNEDALTILGFSSDDALAEWLG
jgi:hypothetical protein